jgi:dipeptidyl aminopeptidase/acylaminoacyl peptidase
MAQRLFPALLCAAAALLASNACAEKSSGRPHTERACAWVVRESREATASEAAFQDPNPLLRNPENANYVPGPKGVTAVVATDQKHFRHLMLEDSATPDVKELLIGAGIPRWSPDAKWIACAVWKSPEKTDVLTIIEVETGRVFEPDLDCRAGEYAWAPDGGSIAVIGDDSRGAALCLVQVPSGKSRLLTKLPIRSEYSNLSWSPDSRMIATTVTQELDHLAESTDLYAVDVDGGSCRLTSTATVDESEPRWLDDGHLLYEAQVAGTGTGWRVMTLERRHLAE